MEIKSVIKDNRQLFMVGKLEFETYAEAEEFVEWVSFLLRRRRELAEAAEGWAGRQQQERGSGNPILHDVVTSLAYLSFVLAAAGAVDQLHLTMSRRITSVLEAAYQRKQAEGEEQSPQKPPQKKKFSSGPGMGM